VLRALSFTNLAGLDLPTEFAYAGFEPVGGRLAPIVECEGAVNAFRARCSLDSFLPKLPGGREAQIKDFRFQSPEHLQENAFAYRASRWLTPTEVRELSGFTNYLAWEQQAKQVPKLLKDATPTSRASSASTRVLTATFLVLSTMVMIFLWKVSFKRRAIQQR
jgi:hypothetical protein